MKRVLFLCFVIAGVITFTAGQVTAGVTEKALSYSVSADYSVDFFAIHIDAEMPAMIALSEAVTVYGAPVEHAVILFTEEVTAINKAPPRCMKGHAIYKEFT